MFEVALCGGSSAAWPGAGGVPDLGQVAELDPGILALGLESVITLAGGDRVEGDGQVSRPVFPGVQLPDAVSVSGGPCQSVAVKANPGPSRVPRGGSRPSGGPGFPRFSAVPAVSLGSWPGAPVADGVSLLVGHGHAPGGLRVLGGGVRQVAGQVGIDGAEAGDLAGPLGQAQQGGQRDGQVDPPGEPVRQRAGPRRRARGGRPVQA